MHLFIAVYTAFALATVLVTPIENQEDEVSVLGVVSQPVDIQVVVPTPSLEPLPSPTVTPTSTPTIAPTLKPTKKPGSNYQQVIMRQINDYRKSKGLSVVQLHPDVCAFARTRAEEISHNFGHGGFVSRLETNTFPYSTYTRVTENIGQIDNYNDLVSMWINSPTHAENMRQDTPYVCVIQYGSFYAYEGWRP